jgi:hypothetical protein
MVEPASLHAAKLSAEFAVLFFKMLEAPQRADGQPHISSSNGKTFAP